MALAVRRLMVWRGLVGGLALLIGTSSGGSAQPSPTPSPTPPPAPSSAQPPPAASPPDIPANTADGQRAYGAGDFDRAYAIWSNLAAHGDDLAALNLASMLDQGNGVARDSVAALRWYRMAAEHGLPEAEFDVGIMLDSGRGADRDVAAAATWYARAASHRHRRAQYNLGQLYAAGEGVPRNPEIARVWYRLAAANGVPAATSKLPPTGKAALSSAVSELKEVAPQYPPRDARITASPPTGEVEFVWAAPPQPGPVTFFVEVDDTAGGQSRLVASRYVAETAVALDLGTAPGVFTWRVYVVDQRHQRYAIGDWQPFAIAAGAAG